MAREELGTKRVCPESGRKFYDLKKEPIVSPYSGLSYPLSFFEGEKDKVTKPDDTKASATDPKAAAAETDDADDGAELVSLEEADAEATGEDIPDLDDDEDDSAPATDDTFLEEEEEDGNDIGINVDVEEKEDQ